MTITDIAARLDTARRRHVAIAPFTDSDPSLDLAMGYAVQRYRRRGRRLAGWKLGLTSTVKQRQVGVETPLYGYLEAAMALDPGRPLPTGELIQPRAEPEIVFTLGADLTGPHIDVADVLGATVAVAAGIEILDSSFEDYRFTPADLAADNVAAGRYLVGPSRPLEDFDLDLVGVTMEKNGHVVESATGAAVMGHPARAVAWLARRLHADGDTGLRRGQIIFSGGLTAAVPIAAGDAVTVDIGHLGRLTLRCA
ncbi:2-keto-4-pentenoate hydratase [Nocardia araoensis]|uniref:2-keto-4-pentenoate hydratase n=1 Tax=Nocardia araoensis TaxID=228600 RepID=UPI0002D80418|nr:fumarylacetoacetate hydrolase family protein [Nocardia araoensis]